MEAEQIQQQVVVGPRRSGWLRLLKWLIVTLLSLVAITVVALILITTIYQKRITNLAIGELNKQLKSELKVNGKVRLSLFRHFPYATVTLNDVALGDAINNLKSPLVKADRISLNFRLWSLFSSHITVKEIEVDNGEINLKRDKSKGNNYDIVKEQSGNGSSGSSMNFSIQEAKLKDVAISYVDEVAGYQLGFAANETKLSGTFNADEFDLSVLSDLTTKDISIKGTTIPDGENLNLDFKLHVDSKKGLYTFNKSTLKIEDNLFKITGSISTATKMMLDLDLQCEDGELEGIVSLLPESDKKRLGKFNSTGKFTIEAKAKGEISSKSSPALNVDFALTKGSISQEKIRGTLTNVSVEGNYNNGSLHNLSTSSFAISSFRALLDNQTIKGNCEIDNLSDPLISVNLDAALNLSKIYPLLNLPGVSGMTGSLILSQFYFSGSYKDIKNIQGLKNFALKGKAEIIDASVKQGEHSYENMNGTLVLENNNLKAVDLTLHYLNSDYLFNGELTNLIPYMQSQNDSLMKNVSPLVIKGELKSQKFNLNDLTSLIGSSDGKDTGGTGNISSWLNVDARLKLSVDQFNYNLIDASAVSGNFNFANHSLNCTNLAFSTMDGKIILNGNIYITGKGRIRSNLDVGCYNIDIEKLFAECQNFDQNEITDKNMRGTVNAAFNAKTVFDEHGNILEDSIIVDGGIVINNGELYNYSSLYALSSYIDMDELRHIKFSTLQNTISINHRTVFIPMMTIHSSALNLAISGSHTFSNVINYQIKVNLLQVLSKKFRFAKLKEDEYEKTEDGGLNLYISMTGTADDPIIKYNKTSAKDKINESLKEQHKELKDVFKKEFGKEKQPDNPKDFQKQDKDEELQPIDWDDN